MKATTIHFLLTILIVLISSCNASQNFSKRKHLKGKFRNRIAHYHGPDSRKQVKQEINAFDEYSEETSTATEPYMEEEELVKDGTKTRLTSDGWSNEEDPDHAMASSSSDYLIEKEEPSLVHQTTYIPSTNNEGERSMFWPMFALILGAAFLLLTGFMIVYGLGWEIFMLAIISIIPGIPGFFLFRKGYRIKAGIIERKEKREKKPPKTPKKPSRIPQTAMRDKRFLRVFLQLVGFVIGIIGLALFIGFIGVVPLLGVLSLAILFLGFILVQSTWRGRNYNLGTSEDVASRKKERANFRDQYRQDKIQARIDEKEYRKARRKQKKIDRIPVTEEDFRDRRRRRWRRWTLVGIILGILVLMWYAVSKISFGFE